MTFNPRYVPWVTLCSLLGGGVGYVAFGQTSTTGPLVPALYGFLAGTFVGMLIMIGLRVFPRKQPAQPVSTEQPPKLPGEQPPDKSDPPA